MKAVSTALEKYQQVLETLREMSEARGHVGIRSAGLLEKWGMAITYVSLGLVRSILAVLDRLVISLQKSSCTVSMMIGLVREAIGFLENMREEADDAIRHHVEKASALSLELIEVPRCGRPPSRYTGTAEAFRPTTAVQWLRKEYFAFIDATLVELRSRFDQDGVHEHAKLEKLLIGPTDRESLEKVHNSLEWWPEELDVDSLSSQLHVFLSRKQVTCLKDAQEAFKNLSQDARTLLPQVEQLLRQLMVLPATSATAERSFSKSRYYYVCL